MVTSNNDRGIALDRIGMRESSVKTRIKIEENHNDTVFHLYNEAIKRIKKVTKTETGEPNYISFAISKFLEEYGISVEDKVTKTRLAYLLRGSKNIATKLGEADNRVVPDNMKPFAYSFVSEAKKREMGLDAICMKSLSKEMKAYIKQCADKIEAKSDIYDLLLVCDYLVGRSAHKKWSKLMGLKMAADLGQPIKRTRLALEELILANIFLTGQAKRRLRGFDTICHLAFSKEEYSLYNNQLMTGKAEDEYRSNESEFIKMNSSIMRDKIDAAAERLPKEETEKFVDLIKNDPENKVLFLKEKTVVSSEDDSSNTLRILQQENKDISLSDEDIKCLSHLVKRLGNIASEKNKDVKEERKIGKLQELITSLQKENTDLRTELAKTESKMNKLKHELKIQTDFNQAYSAEARKSMNQLISSVTSTTEAFTQIPAKRVTSDDIAEFKNGIISAAVQVQNRLKDFKYSISVENLKN